MAIEVVAGLVECAALIVSLVIITPARYAFSPKFRNEFNLKYANKPLWWRAARLFSGLLIFAVVVLLFVLWLNTLEPARPMSQEMMERSLNLMGITPVESSR